MQLIQKWVRGIVLALVTFALISQTTIAAAQTVPGGGVNRAAASAMDGPPVMVDQNGNPVATTSIGSDTTTPTLGQYVAKYPSQGVAGYNRARAATSDKCAEANAIMAELHSIVLELEKSRLTYDDLKELYNKLPGRMKRNAVLTTVMQAGSMGALCALTAGLYCIAAVVSGVGNISSIFGSLQMTLANIRLSQANIDLTLANIRLQRLNARATAGWVRFAYPFCQQAGYTDVAPDWTQGQ